MQYERDQLARKLSKLKETLWITTEEAKDKIDWFGEVERAWERYKNLA